MAIKTVNSNNTSYKIDTNSGNIVPPAPNLTILNDVRVQAGLNKIDANGTPIPNSAPNPINNPPPAGTITNNTSIIDKLNNTNYSYPKELGSNQTYIKFQAYDFTDVQKSKQVYGVYESNEAITNINPYSNATIKLYTPPGINVSYGANWGQGALGSIGNITGNPAEGFNVAASQTLSTQIKGGIAKLVSLIPGTNVTGEQLLGLTTGLIFNKNEFSTFSNMNFRTFNYSFLFVSRNQEETKSINAIINYFKISMHPGGANKDTTNLNASILTALNSSTPNRPAVLAYPKLWTMTYVIGTDANTYLPKTKYCALLDMRLNYTPSSLFTTLTNGAIPAIQMDLTFKELTPLIADEILDSSKAGSNFKGSTDSNSLAINGAIF